MASPLAAGVILVVNVRLVLAGEHQTSVDQAWGASAGPRSERGLVERCEIRGLVERCGGSLAPPARRSAPAGISQVAEAGQCPRSARLT